jgi:hypothetical protein
MTDLVNDHVPAKSKGEQQKAGAWKEAEVAPPPPPTPGPAKLPGAKGEGGKLKDPKTGEKVEKVPSKEAAKSFADGMKAVGELAKRSEQDPFDEAEIRAALKAIRRKYGFRTLEPIDEGAYWGVEAELNPKKSRSQRSVTIKRDPTGTARGTRAVGSREFPTISTVAPDWATKGAHVHVGKTELKVLPGSDGSVVLKPVFSGTKDKEFNAAAKVVENALRDAGFRAQLIRAVTKARDSLAQSGLQGGVAKSAELSFLLVALRRLA